MRIHSKQGRPISTVDAWERPKVVEHWKPGRSAYELAEAWCGTGQPVMPAALRALLETCEVTRGFEPEEGYPEHRISFDALKGEPRNADLALIGAAGDRKIAITIEAKADETFGSTVSEALIAGLEAGIENHDSGRIRRIESLAQSLFRPRDSKQPHVGELRYQLLTAVAGTLAFAQQRQAAAAVLIIHEFVTDSTSDDLHRRNAADLSSFLERLTGEMIDLSRDDRLHGPFQVSDASLYPGTRPLFIGKVTTNRRERYLRAQSAGARGPRFKRYIGIDYSGAKVPTESLKGLRVYAADRGSEPVEVQPPQSPRRYWTRKGVAEWLVEQLSQGPSTIVGIDHGFSFPLAYFERYGLAHDWPAFLDDFWAHWPTDGDHTYVDFIRDGAVGDGKARMGSTKWKRLTESRSKSAKSLFHFDVQGSVAKSTHSGLPWLRFIRNNVTRPVHFWPFEGWDIPAGASAIVEVYPRQWNRGYEKAGRTDDQHDAWVVSEWLRTADATSELQEALLGPSDPAERRAALIEGWILGV